MKAGTGAALLAALALAAAGCRQAPQPQPQPVDPARHDRFFLWAGVPPPPAVARARELYILGGEVRRGGPVRMTPMRAGPPRVQTAAVWLTVRTERLDWDGRTWDAVRAMLARWRAAAGRLEGLQIDFDAATPGLDRYRAFLESVRRELPPGTRLSITGLMDWSANGDPAELARLAGLVDEVVIQTYQGRHTIPGYADWFRHIDTLPLIHKIALVEGGEWAPPPALARDRRFAGYVVFLLKPSRQPATQPVAGARGPRQP
ncbi:hypothetical protein AQZ52_11245 [Novosphingobium fuchskuhlense]|uniref:DUF3142 domain-containing protein n=1 Tax=Novosphingobium fuchskuhlense TaxID=1117702 RepID=A0A124JUH2_9SPHN|nr:hypothetical protein AQZ52_11245 [Novosphingobium fuchskuhlense]